MFEFLIITVIFGAICWFAQNKGGQYGWIIAAVFALVWLFKYLLPFLGVSL